MASIVTVAPRRFSARIRSGIAVISLDLSSTRVVPSVSPSWVRYAEIM